jgi:hypothetical protein
MKHSISAVVSLKRSFGRIEVAAAAAEDAVFDTASLSQMKNLKDGACPVYHLKYTV